MKTNCLNMKHSSFCTMGVSPTATGGGGRIAEAICISIVSLCTHIPKAFHKWHIPQPTGGLTGLGSPVQHRSPPISNRGAIPPYRVEGKSISLLLITWVNVVHIWWTSPQNTHCSLILGKGPAHQLLTSSLDACKTHLSKCTTCHKEGLPPGTARPGTQEAIGRQADPHSLFRSVLGCGPGVGNSVYL